jgi:hypothetical protein
VRQSYQSAARVEKAEEILDGQVHLDVESTLHTTEES